MMESPSSRKRLKMENPVGSMLSELPNDIARQILCLIDPTNEEAIKLSLVSKDFRSLLESRPSLRLDRDCIDSHKYAGELKYILTTLEKYRGNLKSFACRTGSGFDDDTHNRCIELAIEKGVQNLDLCMMGGYILPQCIFKVESLVCLNLTDCFLQLETMRMIEWPKLKNLHLEEVEMAEGVFESMMGGSPLLQVLEISQCCQNSPSFHFQVSDLSCLKKLEVALCDFQTLHLNNVGRKLEYLVCSYGQLDIGSCEYAGLKILSLNCATTDDKLFFKTDFERKFPHLEELYIQEHSNLARIKICSQSLKKLKLMAMEELQEVCLELPNIDVFSYSSLGDTGISIPLLSFEGNSRGWTSCIELVESSATESWLMELNQFLDALKGSQTWMDVYLGQMEDDDAVSFTGMLREPHKHTTGTTFTVTSAKVIAGGAIWNCTPDTLTFQNWTEIVYLLLAQMKWTRGEDLVDEMVESVYEDEDADQEMAEFEDDEDPDHFNEDYGELVDEDPEHCSYISYHGEYEDDEDPDHFNEDYGEELEDEDSDRFNEDSGELEDEDPKISS